MTATSPTSPHPEVSATGAPGRTHASWKSVALPSEHGGWSLTAEPALLALIVVFSWSGMALGIAAMLAFVARTPLKLVLVDRWRNRWLPRESARNADRLGRDRAAGCARRLCGTR